MIEGRETFSETGNCRAFIAFLIDTLPIRNVVKSFDCFIGTHSNRHSPEPLKLHQNRAGRKNPSRRQTGILKRALGTGILVG